MFGISIYNTEYLQNTKKGDKSNLTYNFLSLQSLQRKGVKSEKRSGLQIADLFNNEQNLRGQKKPGFNIADLLNREHKC